jgi:hypothetical protein
MALVMSWSAPRLVLPLLRRPIVQLAAAESRALPAVASNAIGYADARLGGHSQGIGTYEETDGTRPGLVIFTSPPWPAPSCAVTQTATKAWPVLTG